jgi:DDE superfamily endonuclease
LLETAPEAMPPCFEKWCLRYDDIFARQTQRNHYRTYLAGLLRESPRKNIAVLASSTIGANYYNLHHFLHDAPWDAETLNNRRLEIIWLSRQTRPASEFKLIIDYSGHRKSGSSTDAVGRQYLGQIGKVDNGMVMVTTHIFDGKRGYPVDLATYKPASSLEGGKENAEFTKKPDLALALVDKCLKRGMRPGVVLMDSGYGNNTPFLLALEEKELKYVASVVSVRRVSFQMDGEPKRQKHRLDELAKNINSDDFKKITLELDDPRDVWVSALQVFVPKLGMRTLAIQMNAESFDAATDVSYFFSNEDPEIATAEWITRIYSERNWIEVFYREVKGWLGMTEYQVRDLRSIERHWHLVFDAFTFLSFQRWTGGLQKHYSKKPILSFGDAFRVFNHAVECFFLKWLQPHWYLFVAHRAAQGLICY